MAKEAGAAHVPRTRTLGCRRQAHNHMYICTYACAHIPEVAAAKHALLGGTSEASDTSVLLRLVLTVVAQRSDEKPAYIHEIALHVHA